MGRIRAICVSAEKGTPKRPVERAALVADHGIAGDAHAGPGDRQISMLPLEGIEEFRRAGAEVAPGDFGENLVVEGLDWAALGPGARLRCGDAVLEVTRIGKECLRPCRIHERMGDCIMPRIGVFARAAAGGEMREGMAVEPVRSFRVALLTVSDKGSAGRRGDASGDAMRDIVEAAGLEVAAREIVPDDLEAIAAVLRRFCDELGVSLALTSGGTGFSPRDVTPEATLQVVERLCPGIPEAMRAFGLAATRRAMLSRAAAGIRGRTLIVNLPGSPRAVRECLEATLDAMLHGLEVLRGDAGDCAR